jgi:hypothetical protein
MPGDSMKRTILKTFTVLWLFGMYIVLMLTFMAAYQSPDRAVRVAINQAGEAEVEFFMLLGALFLTTMGTLFIITDIRRDLRGRMIGRFIKEA